HPGGVGAGQNGGWEHVARRGGGEGGEGREGWRAVGDRLEPEERVVRRGVVGGPAGSLGDAGEERAGHRKAAARRRGGQRAGEGRRRGRLGSAAFVIDLGARGGLRAYVSANDKPLPGPQKRRSLIVASDAQTRRRGP